MSQTFVPTWSPSSPGVLNGTYFTGTPSAAAIAVAMSGETPSGSPLALRPVTSRKLERLTPARRTPVGASSARALSDMKPVYTEDIGEGKAMKITDVSLTLFAWDDIPPTQYGQHSRFAGSSALGLLRIRTDDGVEGNAFLGSASNAATTDGQGLITHLKPVLMGKNPLHREALVQDLWRKQRVAGVRAIGAVDVALWDLLGKAVGQPIHRLLGTYRESVPAYASSA